MSELTEQIRVTCESIAENQKKVYDLGFKEGKASVKIITFYIVTDWEEEFNALSNMTWRQFAGSVFDKWGSISIRDNKVWYNSSRIDADPDDVIVELGYYRTITVIYLAYNSNTYELSCYYYQNWSEWVESEFNTIGLYFGDDDLLKTPTGETVVADSGGDYLQEIHRWDIIEWGAYKALKIGECDIHFETALFEVGMTWYDYIDSSYNTGVYLDEMDVIHHFGGNDNETYYHNGVQVNPSDLMIDGATYEYR